MSFSFFFQVSEREIWCHSGQILQKLSLFGVSEGRQWHTDILFGFSYSNIVCNNYHTLLYILDNILLDTKNVDVITSTMLFIWISTK